jgi:hypothetical protein
LEDIFADGGAGSSFGGISLKSLFLRGLLHGKSTSHWTYYSDDIVFLEVCSTIEAELVAGNIYFYEDVMWAADTRDSGLQPIDLLAVSRISKYKF